MAGDFLKADRYSIKERKWKYFLDGCGLGKPEIH